MYLLNKFIDLPGPRLKRESISRRKNFSVKSQWSMDHRGVPKIAQKSTADKIRQKVNVRKPKILTCLMGNVSWFCNMD